MRLKRPNKTTLKVNKSNEGETIEAKVRRILNNKEPIKDGAPRVFTERKDGVRPEFDVRADKWEAAVEVTTTMSNSHAARREERQAEKQWDTMTDSQRSEFKVKYPHNPLSKADSIPKA